MKTKTRTVPVITINIVKHQIKKWCIEQAIRVSRYDKDGNLE